MAEIIVPDRTKETSVLVAKKIKNLCEQEGLVLILEGKQLSKRGFGEFSNYRSHHSQTKIFLLNSFSLPQQNVHHAVYPEHCFCQKILHSSEQIVAKKKCAPCSTAALNFFFCTKKVVEYFVAKKKKYIMQHTRPEHFFAKQNVHHVVVYLEELLGIMNKV